MPNSLRTLPVPFLLLLAVTMTLADDPAVPREGHTAELPDLEIYYEVSGQGEPLVILHGILETGKMFDPLVDAMGGTFRTYVVDLRGHGGSTNPGGEFTFRQSAKDILALMDHLQIETFRAIGYSAGAETLLHIATQQPDRITAMALIGSGTYLTADCRKTVATVTAATTPPDGWERMRKKHHHGDEQIRLLLDTVGALKDSYGDIAFTPAMLAKIQAGTLLIQGDSDYCFPLSMIAEMEQAIPDAAVWVLPNAGHWPFRDDQVPLLAETVVDFLGGDSGGE